MNRTHLRVVEAEPHAWTKPAHRTGRHVPTHAAATDRASLASMAFGWLRVGLAVIAPLLGAALGTVTCFIIAFHDCL